MTEYMIVGERRWDGHSPDIGVSMIGLLAVVHEMQLERILGNGSRGLWAARN